MPFGRALLDALQVEALFPEIVVCLIKRDHFIPAHDFLKGHRLPHTLTHRAPLVGRPGTRPRRDKIIHACNRAGRIAGINNPKPRHHFTSRWGGVLLQEDCPDRLPSDGRPVVDQVASPVQQGGTHHPPQLGLLHVHRHHDHARLLHWTGAKPVLRRGLDHFLNLGRLHRGSLWDPRLSQ